jgi:hypothetical protein
MIVVSAATTLIDGAITDFSEALIFVSTTAVLRLAGLGAVARWGRAGLAEVRRLALADAFFTDLRADLVDFLRADAAALADRPAVLADALLMGW